MNFENYNKIYKEILDDEKEELSSNYLLNKYEIKHDEELLNILNQIKKNEYISSDNKIINKLLSELDENEDLLDINEIINIKDKVLDLSSMDLQDEIDTEEIIDNKTEKKPIDIRNIKKTNYYLYALPFAVVLVATLYLSKDKNSEEVIIKKELVSKIEKVEPAKIIIQSKEKVEKEILVKSIEDKPKEVVAKIKEAAVKVEAIAQEKEIRKEEIVSKLVKEEPKELVSDAKKITIKKVEEVSIKELPQVVKEVEKEILDNTTNTVASKSNSEDKLNKIEATTEKKIILSTLDEINKYKNKLEYKDNKLFFDGKYYEENNTLFGFKIFKITPLYVKFEDVNQKIRKRFLIK